MPSGSGVQILSFLILLLLAVCQIIASHMKEKPKDNGTVGIMISFLVFAMLRCIYNLVMVYSQKYVFSDLIMKWVFQLNLTSALLLFSGSFLAIRSSKVRNNDTTTQIHMQFFLFLIGFNVFVNLLLNSSIFFSSFFVTVENGCYVYGEGRKIADIIQFIGTMILFFIIVVLRKNLTKLERWTFYGFVFMPFFAGILLVLGINDLESDCYTIAMDISVMFVFIGQFLGHNIIIESVNKEKEETEEELMNMLSDRDLLTQAFNKLVLFSYRVNIEKNNYRELKTTEWFRDVIGLDENPHRCLERWVKVGVDVEYEKFMEEFIDLTTLSERMKERDVLSTELKSTLSGQWLRLDVVCINRLANGNVNDTLWIVQSISDEKEREQQIKDAAKKIDQAKFEAEHDALTGLYNRAGFDRLTSSFELKTSSIGIVLIDVDNFKGVNDNYGHDIGDKVLRLVGKELKENFSSNDYLFRFGGDEFAVVFNYYQPDSLKLLKARMEEINKKLIENKTDDMPEITLSSGAAISPNGYSAELFKNADNNLYEVKRGGKAGCCIGK